MRGALRLLPVLLAALLLAGCAPGGFRDVTVAREIEDLALIRAMGVDRTPEGVRVTLASARDHGTGGQDGESGTAVVLSQSAATISRAIQQMQHFGSRSVFYGHVNSYLVGETLAREGLWDYLDYVERNAEMRLDTDLCVVRAGTANALITAMTGEDYDISERLEFLRENADLAADTMPATVRQVIARTERSGCTLCPALRLAEHREGDGARGDWALLPAGYAVLREGRLIGYLDGEAAYGANLLLGQVAEDVVEVTVDGVRVALRVSDCRTRVRPTFGPEGSLTALRVRVRLRAGVDEAEGPLDLSDPQTARALTDALTAAERGRMEAAMARLRAWDADCLQLGARAALAAPVRWQEEAWSPAAIPVVIEAEAVVDRSYDSV